MPLLEKFVDKNHSLAIWELTESVATLGGYLSKEYTTELEMYSSENRKKEFLAARILLKLLTGEEKEIEYLFSGKPLLKDKSFRISISHTRKYVSVIVSPVYSVGIDIEYISDRVLRIRKRFLSKQELDFIEAKQDILYPLLYWSAKESLFKLLGETDVTFNTDLHLLPFDIRKDCMIRSFETRTSCNKKPDIYFRIYDDFVLTWIVYAD